MIDTARHHIAVEGPIGAGKSSLARLLADALSATLIMEQVDDNPFLPGFYQDPARYALATQLHFLFQRAKQLESAGFADNTKPLVVADYMWEKDRIFAGINLSAEELVLYDRVQTLLKAEVAAPDLVVYLQAPVEVLLERVRRRAVPYEQGISPEYLVELSSAYHQFFHYYDASPMLIINVEAIDFVHNKADFALLLKRIRETRSGRHYFNPRG